MDACGRVNKFISIFKTCEKQRKLTRFSRMIAVTLSESGAKVASITSSGYGAKSMSSLLCHRCISH